jgi:HTH-type transcriptional regulator / antitoxin HipB
MLPSPRNSAKIEKSMRSNKTAVPFAQELGKAIRKQRKSLKLTQQQLGQFAGCGALFVHDLERGKPTVRLHKVVDVLKVLGLQLTLEPGKHGFQVR